MGKAQDSYVSSKQNEQAKTAVLLISADNFNELELFYPYYRFCEAGYRVDVASPDGEVIKGADGHELATRPLEKLNPADYALLYLPGGKAPAKLMKDEQVLDFVNRFADLDRPIASICHGAQILAAADLVDGKRISAWPEVEEEIREAGGTYVNAPLIEDGQFITARWPGDLPMHLEAALKRIAAGGGMAQRAA